LLIENDNVVGPAAALLKIYSARRIIFAFRPIRARSRRVTERLSVADFLVRASSVGVRDKVE
jgi:hypothetical protein